MNDGTDPDLERILRGLPLRVASATLDDRIADSVRRPAWHPARWAIAAAVLLATVGTLRLTVRRASPPIARAEPPATSPVQPVSVERETSQTFDDGVVIVAGRVPYRQLRQQTLREIWWTDPGTGARLWAQLPSEHVTVVPGETF